MDLNTVAAIRPARTRADLAALDERTGVLAGGTWRTRGRANGRLPGRFAGRSRVVGGARLDRPGFQPTARTLWGMRCARCAPLDALLYRMVGDTGLEPVTSCMSSKCSNQLS